MPNPYFQFKKFTVWHDRCAMKVGTDGVLLGAWATVLPDENLFYVLDIGTGTGLIAMIIAQRYDNAKIDALDIDKNACEQAIENVEKSPFKDRITVIHKPFMHYSTTTKYELIISNPPFFKDSLKCPDGKRNMARHNDSLPLKQLIEHAMTMLSENGRIALILPTQLSEELDFIIATHRLFIVRRTDIIPVEGLQPKRVLIELSTRNFPDNKTVNTLTLETKDHKRTIQYSDLTKKIYL
jgi:tRNA1Val (adenine37-N6)-methyltransferase